MAATPPPAVQSAPTAWPSLGEIHEKLSWLDGLRPDFDTKPLEPWLAEWKRLQDTLSIGSTSQNFMRPSPEESNRAYRDLVNFWFGSLAVFAEHQGHFEHYGGHFVAPKGKTAFPDFHWLIETPLLRQLDTVQTIVRELAMAVSRPRIRALTIFDLPEEVTRAIFGYFSPEFGSQPRDVEGHLQAEDSFGYRDIQRIRLACRRFHDASSHLLLQCVVVEMQPKSLERLEKIANHPFISKGIETIAVDLKYYRDELASSLERFTELALSKLEEQIESYSESNSVVDVTPFRFPATTASDHRVCYLVDQKAEMIAREWNEFHSVLSYELHAAPQPRFDKMIRKAMLTSKPVNGLVGAHRVYEERYRAQQDLITAGTFSRAIVSALAKMPCATRLHMGDTFHTPSRCSIPFQPFSMAVNDPQFLAESAVTRPATWLDASGARDLPKSVFIDTLVAVFGSGQHKIRALVIGMSVDPAVHIPATQEQLDLLKQTTQDMLSFDLTCHSSWLPPVDRDLLVPDGSAQPTTIESVALACAGFKRTRELALDFKYQLGPPATYDEPRARTRGARICRQPFLELENLTLSSLGLHLHELKTLLQHMPQTCRSVKIVSLWLFTGSWGEALDLLRDQCDKGTWITLYGPCRGGECEDLAKEKQLLLFQPSKARRKKFEVARADGYIRREGDHQAVNPFTDLDALDADVSHVQFSDTLLVAGLPLISDSEESPSESDIPPDLPGSEWTESPSDESDY